MIVLAFLEHSNSKDDMVVEVDTNFWQVQGARHLSTGDKNSLLSCENIPLGPHHDSADDWNSHIDSPGDQHGDWKNMLWKGTHSCLIGENNMENLCSGEEMSDDFGI